MKEILAMGIAPALRDRIRERLDREGLECTWAEDGVSGLRILGDRSTATLPEALLIELHMRRTDGLGVLRSLRSSGTSVVPTILLCEGMFDRDLCALNAAHSLGATHSIAVGDNQEQAVDKIVRALMDPGTPCREQRRFLRKQVAMPVLVQFQARQRKVYDATVEDLSLGGARLRFPYPDNELYDSVDEASRFNMVFTTNDSAYGNFACRRCRVDNDDTSLAMGAAFTRLSTDSLRELRAYL